MAVVEAANRIIVPGFIDTHTHSYQGLLRSTLPNGLVEPDYNRDIQNLLTPAYEPDEVYAGELITALGMIEMRTTTIVDISQISHTPDHSDACIHALQESGIRAVHAYSRGAGPLAQYPQDIARLQRTYFNSTDQLLTLAMAVSTDPVTFRAARESGLPAVLHIRVNPEPLLQLGRAGLLRPGDEFVHCTHLNNDAWNLIRDSGGRISLAPPLEMAMGHGMPAIQEAVDHGMRPSFSSDHSATVARICSGSCGPRSICSGCSCCSARGVANRICPPFSPPARCSNSLPSRVRVARPSMARSARSRPARKPTF
jgi:5-methylthioadenosine/S-adenosylhomocysteine deaminase